MPSYGFTELLCLKKCGMYLDEVRVSEHLRLYLIITAPFSLFFLQQATANASIIIQSILCTSQFSRLIYRSIRGVRPTDNHAERGPI